MRAIRWILCALLAVTAVLFAATGIMETRSGKNEGPVLQCPEDVLEISVQASRTELLSGVTARDEQDGDLTDRIIIGGISKLIGGDMAQVTCMVFDSDDNMASLVRLVRYTDYHRPVIQLTAPLEYAASKDAKLLSRISVTDVVDGDISDRARVSTLWATEDERVFSATVTVTNSMGDMADVEVPVIIRSTPSSIRLSRQIAYLDQGAEFDPLSYVSSGTTGLSVRCEGSTDAPGCWWVWYSKDSGDDFAILTVVVE